MKFLEIYFVVYLNCIYFLDVVYEIIFNIREVLVFIERKIKLI